MENDFTLQRLHDILEDTEQIEDWRVGEAIADAYLTDHRSCYFPWPIDRDKKRHGSSLPGADLIGFGEDEYGDCFAFGEVKTSSDQKSPPRVVHGTKGLKRQLEDLRDYETIRDGLMRYLAHRAGLAPWKERFQQAVQRYLRNSCDVQIYGYLVRDVEPDPDDLRACISYLSEICPDGMYMELIALYVPQGKLESIGKEIIAIRKRMKQ